MKAMRNVGALSVTGLVGLALIALVLSGLALNRFSGRDAAPAPPTAFQPSTSSSGLSLKHVYVSARFDQDLAGCCDSQERVFAAVPSTSGSA